MLLGMGEHQGFIARLTAGGQAFLLLFTFGQKTHFWGISEGA
jgi:hypothetical protein